MGSTSSSVYLEQRNNGLDSDSDLFPASDEEEDDVFPALEILRFY